MAVDVLPYLFHEGLHAGADALMAIFGFYTRTGARKEET